jgi:hypothetical protein
VFSNDANNCVTLNKLDEIIDQSLHNKLMWCNGSNLKPAHAEHPSITETGALKISLCQSNDE